MDPLADVPLACTFLGEVEDTGGWGKESQVEGSGAADDTISGELVNLEGSGGGLQLDIDVDLLVQLLLLELQQLE